MEYEGTLIGKSNTPLFAAARWLKNNALAADEDIIETWRDGMRCMSAKVGVAAQLTVSETTMSGPTIGKWKPMVRYWENSRGEQDV